MVNTVADLIELWPSAEVFGADIGLKWPGHARVMKLRGRIPDDYWPKVVAAARQRGIPVTEQVLKRIHRSEPAAVEAAS
jgi:hypothetical protein